MIRFDLSTPYLGFPSPLRSWFDRSRAVSLFVAQQFGYARHRDAAAAESRGKDARDSVPYAAAGRFGLRTPQDVSLGAISSPRSPSEASSISVRSGLMGQGVKVRITGDMAAR